MLQSAITRTFHRAPAHADQHHYQRKTLCSLQGSNARLKGVSNAASRLTLKSAAKTSRRNIIATAKPVDRYEEPIASSVASVNYDFVVIGSGIAGLSYAIEVAAHGRVAIITKEKAHEGSTRYAQGGICAVLDEHDTIEKHIQDTIVAGSFLNDYSAVETVCSEGPQCIMKLVDMGADFTKNKDGTLHLTREGGHSDRRIVHAADMTGSEIERALLDNVRSHPSIDIYEHHLAIDLVTRVVNGSKICLGVDVLDSKKMSLTRFCAPVTLLASGGGGQVYPNSTNPSVATGDGIAMAHRAQAIISNMEFVQFHPTGLYSCNSEARRFLISEAVRGEGGRLLNFNGDRFMCKYDDRLELAPRDVVARAIDNEMKSRGDPHVWLDISHKPKNLILHHFPNIAAQCAREGIDICKDPIPVVPTQHYMCGGVQTGLNGETSLLGLFAAGEVACTGLHGANRLASNSLLEGLVYGFRAAQASIAHLDSIHVIDGVTDALRAAYTKSAYLEEPAPRKMSLVGQEWVQRKRADVQQLMWNAVGIVRTTKGLVCALEELAQLYVEATELFRSHPVNSELLELVNLVTVAELIVSSALSRQESRGLHFTLDYPEADPSACHPTLINQCLTKRFDLSPILDKFHSTGGVSAAMSAPPRPVGPAMKVPDRFTGKRREFLIRSTLEKKQN